MSVYIALGFLAGSNKTCIDLYIGYSKLPADLVNDDYREFDTEEQALAFINDVHDHLPLVRDVKNHNKAWGEIKIGCNYIICEVSPFFIAGKVHRYTVTNVLQTLDTLEKSLKAYEVWLQKSERSLALFKTHKRKNLGREFKVSEDLSEPEPKLPPYVKPFLVYKEPWDCPVIVCNPPPTARAWYFKEDISRFEFLEEFQTYEEAFFYVEFCWPRKEKQLYAVMKYEDSTADDKFESKTYYLGGNPCPDTDSKSTTDPHK